MPTATAQASSPQAGKRSINQDAGDGILRATKKSRSGPSAAAPKSSSSTISFSLPHPLGVKPAGNALFASSSPSSSSRTTTLGSVAALSDELIMHILTSYDLSPAEVATLSQVSRGMRAFANSEGLWRSLFVECSDTQGKMLSWQGSWKQTLGHHLGRRRPACESRLAEYQTSQPFYSDLLYLPHRLSLLSLDRYVNKASQAGSTSIAREPATLSLTEFHRRYASRNTPVILERPADAAAIPGLGMTIDDLQRRYGEQWIRAEAIHTQVKAYADYARGYERQLRVVDSARQAADDGSSDNESGAASWYDPTTVPDESPYYLFDSELPLRMANDDGLWTVPEQIKHCPDDVYHVRAENAVQSSAASRSLVEADLFSLLSTSRPDWRWIIAGPKRSGSSWHKDPNRTSAWNTPLSGTKFWMMLPPHVTPPGVFLSQDGADITTPLSLIEWLNDFYAETKRLHGSTRNGGDGLLLEGSCGPGETMYVPSGWWHLVVNLDESVALTQNFVSLAELPHVLDFMKNKSEQISGFKFKTATEGGECEDPTVAEGQVDPRSQLYDEFVGKLREYDDKLAVWALDRLAIVEQEERQQRQQHRTADAAPVQKKKGASNNEATWWEKLKSGGGGGGGVESRGDNQTVDASVAAGAQQPQSSFSLGLEEGGEEELGDVPW